MKNIASVSSSFEFDEKNTIDKVGLSSFNGNSGIDFEVFPAEQLAARIDEVLKEYNPGTADFSFFQENPYQQLINQHGLSKTDAVFVALTLAASFAPELLHQLTKASLDASWTPYVGGFFLKGSSVFCPTVRTAIFLLAGRDLNKRAEYTARYHSKHRVFTSGILRTEIPHPTATFLDYQLIFNDQFLGTVLQGEVPALDRDRNFPVRRSSTLHQLSDVVLQEKTFRELNKLRRFAKNMKKLWEINTASKIRNNFIGIFSGDPGTGKSYAAEAIGNELGLPVYKVNFAQMISKYIGETEKNLEKIFDRFDKQACILFFDEAESIFSKRSEVKDSHDQHANNLQSYLLQKVEEFSGIIILATNVHNLAHYFDKAFQRRFRLIVDFEFPDYPERRQLWDRALFEPYAFEDGLTERMAKNYQLSGGSIYNVVSDAVVVALDQNITQITFEMLEEALKDEFKKTGRKYEICTDDMVMTNPARRYGPGYEQRRNF